MAGVFPTFVADPNDPNRRYTGKVGEAWPGQLRAGYYTALAGTVLLLMLVGMVAPAIPAVVSSDDRRKSGS